MISDEELAEIEALAAATPKGPWAASHMDGGYCEVISPEEWVTANIAEVWSGQAIADFIAASRSAIPLLLSAYRELKAENERLDEEGDTIALLLAKAYEDQAELEAERERLINISVALESELAVWTRHVIDLNRIFTESYNILPPTTVGHYREIEAGFTCPDGEACGCHPIHLERVRSVAKQRPDSPE